MSKINNKQLIISLLLILVLLLGVFSILKTNEEKGSTSHEGGVILPNVSPLNGGKKIEENSTFKSPLLGFEINIPAGWYLPVEDNYAPEFFSCPTYACENIQIQQHNEFSERNLQQNIIDLKEKHNKVIELENFIKGAKVLKSEGNLNAEGESVRFTYYIIYYDSKKAFTLSSDGDQLETSILRTFKLIR